MDPSIVVALCALCAVVACSAAALATLQARRSWPIGMRSVADDVQERVHALETRWTRTAADLAGLAEEVTGLLEAVETRRRRIAASDSARRAREDQGSPPGADGGALPADPTARRKAIVELARSKGYRV